MLHIERKILGVHQGFDVRTADEADAEGIKYVHWREVDVPCYALTDDGYVVNYLFRRDYIDKKKRNRSLYVFSVGRVWATKSSRLLWEPRLVSKNYTAVGTGSWKAQEAKKTRTKNAVKLYVKMLMAGKIDWTTIGQAYRPDQEIPRATVKRLFKLQEVKDMVDKEIADLMKGEGLDKSYIVKTIRKAGEAAELKMDAMALLKVAERVAEFLEVSPSQKVGPSHMLTDGSEDFGELMIGASKDIPAIPEVSAEVIP